MGNGAMGNPSRPGSVRILGGFTQQSLTGLALPDNDAMAMPIKKMAENSADIIELKGKR